MALILLMTESFIFKIKGNLTLSSLTFTGVDMHMDAVPCALRPNIQLCSCVLDAAQLYNASSVCSVNKGVIQNNTNVYPGFFQLSN